MAGHAGPWSGRVTCLTLALMLLVTIGAACADVPTARPADMGFDPARLDRVRGYFETLIAEKRVPGAVFLISRKGKVVLFDAVGFADPEEQKALTTEHIFRLASMTKPITALGLLALYEEGRFEMDDPLSRYLPEFGGIEVRAGSAGDGRPILVEAVRPPTIRDVLRHTAGFSYGRDGEYGDDALVRDPYKTTLDVFVRRLASFPLTYQPGTRWIYSYSNDVQGRLIEVLSGQSLDEFLAARFFVPLAMDDTGFTLATHKADRMVSLSIRHANGDLESVADDEPIGAFSGYRAKQWFGPLTFYSGGGGLAGTAEDYWRFCQMLLNGGVFEGTRVLAPRTIALATTDQLGGIEDRARTWRGPSGYGYGFAVAHDPEVTGTMLPAGAYDWSGGFGTQFWVDPETEIVAVFMTQALPHAIAWEVEKLQAIVYGAIVDVSR